MADAVRALKFVESVEPGDIGGVAEILDQLQPVAQREDLDASGLLDMRGQLRGVAGVADDIAERVFGRALLRLHLRAMLGEDLVDRGDPALDQLVGAAAPGHVVGLRHLEAHDVIALDRRAVNRITGAVRPTMLQRLQHRGHLTADIGTLAFVN